MVPHTENSHFALAVYHLRTCTSKLANYLHLSSAVPCLLVLGI